MPKGKYLNADHELIGKLLEKVSDLPKDEDKIHDVLCAICMHNFNSPDKNSTCTEIYNNFQKGKNVNFSLQSSKKLLHYLSYELGPISDDQEYFQMAYFDCQKANSNPSEAANLYRKKDFDVNNINIEYSDQYFQLDELGLEDNNYAHIDLNPEKKETVSTKKENKINIKPENNFLNSKIRESGDIFGPHFKGKTVEEILDKDLSRNVIARLFKGDSKQMEKVFAAVKEINNRNSLLDDSEKAVNLKNALDEYLIYKRPDIETQLNSCKNDDERKNLIDKNNIDFRRYEFCRKLSQHLSEKSAEYGIFTSNHHLNYNQFTAYERENDAIRNGIERIQKEPGFSLGEFLKEKILNPISEFFSSIFTRSNNKSNSTDHSPDPDLEDNNTNTHEETIQNTTTENPNVSRRSIIIHFEKSSNKESSLVSKQEENKKQNTIVNEEIKYTRENPFTEKDKEMIKDLFNNSKRGSIKDKLLELTLLSRIGLIKYQNSSNKENDPLQFFSLSDVFSPTRFRSINDNVAGNYRDFAKAVAKVVGAKESDTPTKDEFIDAYYNLCSETTNDRTENKKTIVENYSSGNGTFKTDVLKNAAKYDDELNQNFIEKQNKNVVPLNLDEHLQGGNNIIEENQSNVIDNEHHL